jgi:hypothetical protein
MLIQKAEIPLENMYPVAIAASLITPISYICKLLVGQKTMLIQKTTRAWKQA